MLFSLSGCACVAHVLRVRSATHARLSRFSAFALRLLVSCCCQAVARCSRTFVRSAPCPRLPRLVRLAPRLVNVWQEITTPLRMLAFRDFQRLLCARLSLCFKHAPRLVIVFLGSCRLLFGKTPLCKQKSSVQDVQPSTTSVVLFHRQTAGEVLTYFVYAPRLVFVFLGSCRLLFGKSPLCKQKSSVQDVQQKHGDLPCFLI